jgi:hypothetical protein
MTFRICIQALLHSEFLPSGDPAYDQTLQLDDSLSVAIRCKSIGDDALALPTLDSDAPLSCDLRQLGTMGVFGQQGWSSPMPI